MRIKIIKITTKLSNNNIRKVHKIELNNLIRQTQLQPMHFYSHNMQLS